MVTVTSRAKEELKRILETSSLKSGKYLRLATPPAWTGEGDWGIVIDEERDGDQAVDFQGLKVLLLDFDLVERLTNAVFDFKDSSEGSRFTLDVF